MKYLKVLITASFILFVSFTAALASPEGKPVTPYGDFCPSCGKYGTCKSRMSSKAAEKAMVEYYHKKDLKVNIEKEKGRFIKARIMDNGKVVDVIIFDRRTGRIRSIY